MKVDDLITSCKAINPLDGKPVRHIYLTIPIKTLPRGDTVGLFGRAGPRGRICNVQEADGGGYRCTAIFPAPAVLAYIARNI